MVAQRLARPVDDCTHRLVHVARRLLDRLVVVALDHHGSLGGVSGNGVDNGLRIGSVSDQIAQECIATGTGFVGVLETRAQRFEITVNVGEKGDDQRLFAHVREVSRQLYRIAAHGSNRALPSSLRLRRAGWYILRSTREGGGKPRMVRAQSR